MNRKSLLAVAAIAAFASINSFAGEVNRFAGEVDPATQFAEPLISVNSRAEVLAELAEYKRNGVNPWSRSYDQFAQTASTKDRADVRAQYFIQRDRVAAIGSEDSGSAYLSQQAASTPEQATLGGAPRRAQY